MNKMLMHSFAAAGHAGAGWACPNISENFPSTMPIFEDNPNLRKMPH